MIHMHITEVLIILSQIIFKIHIIRYSFQLRELLFIILSSIDNKLLIRKQKMNDTHRVILINFFS